MRHLFSYKHSKHANHLPNKSIALISISAINKLINHVTSLCQFQETLIKLSSELVAEGLVVRELVVSEEPRALSDVAAGAVQRSSAAERGTLGSQTCGK